MQTSGGGGEGWGRWLAAVFPLSADMKGSVWEPGGRAHTSRRCCGPDSHPLITARPASQPASLSWDTPWTLHRTDGDLLNMQQSRPVLPLTAAAHMDNVIPVFFFLFCFFSPEVRDQAKNGHHPLGFRGRVEEGGGKHKLHPLSVKLFCVKPNAWAGEAHMFDVAKMLPRCRFSTAGSWCAGRGNVFVNAHVAHVLFLFL